MDLFSACTFGNAEEAAALLAKNPNHLTASDGQSSWTPVHYAANSGNTEVLALLLANGANPNGSERAAYVPRFDRIPLQLAAARGWKSAAECLIEHGACLEERDGDGRTALHQALAERQKEMVELLLARGADPNATTGPSELGWRPIPTRRRIGFGKPRTRAPQPSTPLDYATLHEDKELVQLLLNHGANINLPVNEPLLFSVSIGNPGMAEFLIENGANPRAAIWLQRRNYLHLAGLRGHTAVAELLIKHGVDVNARDRFGDTPLDCAIRADHESLARLLWKYEMSKR